MATTHNNLDDELTRIQADMNTSLFSPSSTFSILAFQLVTCRPVTDRLVALDSFHHPRHINRGLGCRSTTIELARLCPLHRLRDRVRREHAEDDRHVGLQCHLAESTTNLRTDVIKM